MLYAGFDSPNAAIFSTRMSHINDFPGIGAILISDGTYSEVVLEFLRAAFNLATFLLI